jgi:hypothetical protein
MQTSASVGVASCTMLCSVASYSSDEASTWLASARKASRCWLACSSARARCSDLRAMSSASACMRALLTATATALARLMTSSSSAAVNGLASGRMISSTPSEAPARRMPAPR